MQFELKHAGSIQIVPLEPPPWYETILEQLPEEAVPLKPEALQITLVHRRLAEPFRVIFLGEMEKAIRFPPIPQIFFREEPIEVERLGQGTMPYKKSWIALVLNQEQVQDYVNAVLAGCGSPGNLEHRVFHLAVANLTGDPGDLVDDVSWPDVLQ